QTAQPAVVQPVVSHAPAVRPVTAAPSSAVAATLAPTTPVAAAASPATRPATRPASVGGSNMTARFDADKSDDVERAIKQYGWSSGDTTPKPSR
ncbi:hypothetical protein BurMR1_2797, partial [Burkholderia sp. MR1]